MKVSPLAGAESVSPLAGAESAESHHQTDPNEFDNGGRGGGSRLTFGNLMLAVGVVGLVATAVVVALGLRLVDRSGSTLSQSLELTAEAVGAFDDTIDIAADSIDIASTGLATLTAAVADSEGSLRAVGALLEDTADAISQDVPDSIDAIRETMPALIQSAELLDGALGALSFLGVDFAPASPPADSLRRVESGLADVAARLRDGSSQVDEVGRDLADLSGDASSLSTELARFTANLDRARLLLDSYSSTASRTATLVAQTSDDLDSQRREGRLIVLLFGLIVGLGQLVPIAIGWRSRQSFRFRDTDGRVVRPGIEGGMTT